MSIVTGAFCIPRLRRAVLHLLGRLCDKLPKLLVPDTLMTQICELVDESRTNMHDILTATQLLVKCTPTNAVAGDWVQTHGRFHEYARVRELCGMMSNEMAIATGVSNKNGN